MAALNQSQQEMIAEWIGILEGYRTGRMKPPPWMTQAQAVADAQMMLDLAQKL